MTAPGRHRAGGRHRVNPHTLTCVWTPPKPPRKPQSVGERWAGPVITVLVLAMLVVLSPEPSHRSSAVGDGTAGSGAFPSVARPAPVPAPAAPAVRAVPRVVEVRPVPLAQVLPVVDPASVAAPAVQAAVPVAPHEEAVSSVRPRPYVPPVHTHPTTQVPPSTSSVPPTTPPVTTTPPPTTKLPTPSTVPPVLCVPRQEVTR